MEKIPQMKTPEAGHNASALAGDGISLPPDTAIIDDLNHGGGPDELLGYDQSGSGAAPGAWTSIRAAKRRRFVFPFVGQLPFERQVRFFVPLLALAIGLSFLFLWLDVRHSAEMNRVTHLIGEALTHSQRMAKSAPGAIGGDFESFVQLSESRQKVNAALDQLAAVDSVAPALPKVMASWRSSDEAANQLGDQRPLLESLGELRRTILGANPQLLGAAQTVATAKLQNGSSAREISLSGELVMLTQRIAKDASMLVSAEHFDPQVGTTLGQSVRSLGGNADALLRATPANDIETRRALDEVKTLLGTSQKSLQVILDNLAGLQQAKVSERRIFRGSEPLRLELESLREVSAGDGGLDWRVLAAGLCGLIAAIGAFGLANAYVVEGVVRAEDAEAERAIAERQQDQAKRANDLNQAAILRLMNELQEVADGDLTVQATVSDDITGAIADSVNYTVEELRSLVARINSTAKLVNEASSRAQMTATSLQAASEQQSREIRDTGEAVLRMAQQIHEVSARASESVQVAGQSLAASQKGTRAVENAIAGMNGIRDQIQETAKRIKRLGESSQEIGEIVELISDITEQTNVLALNAAIQAASAGEAGRGFTIVAEEVQRLAERSGEATKQIASLIRGIQTDTQDAVRAMELSTQGVVEGTRLSDDAGHALDEIGRVSTSLSELIEGFSNTTSKQAASAGTVAQSIQRILLVTEQTSEGTLQTAGSIRQLAELAQELKNSVARFRVS